MTRIELERMADLNKTITDLERKKEELFERQIRITQFLSDMPKSHTHYDKMAAYVAQVEEIEIAFADVIAEHSALLIRYYRAVATLKEREREILKLKYEERKSWRRIAAALNYSESRAQGIHREALKKIQDF